MKHHRLALKVWITSALTTAVSLAFVSGASAMRNARDPFNLGYGGVDPAPVVSSSSGFNWGVAAIAVPAILAAVLIVVAVARSGRRGNLAVSH